LVIYQGNVGILYLYITQICMLCEHFY
jgi:hypothetical protein